ncbi:hypothetical protein N9T96_01105 [Flavobacteriaceae bacterium]|nr:hypothetical protein [Flavobacteriaceae bacterium]
MNTSRQRPGSGPTKPRMIMVVIAYLMTIDTPLLPLATLMVYSLRLSQKVRSITTAMGSCISSMITRVMKYGEYLSSRS